MSFTNASKTFFRDFTKAFEDAIAQGDLSINPQADNYAGNYMYMHSEGETDSFKHVMSREYIRVDRVLS